MGMGRFIFLVCLIFFTEAVEAQHALDSLNSQSDELYPVLDGSGSKLYFVRRFDSRNHGGMRDPGDIWVSTLKGDRWGTPERLTNFNNRYFNGVVQADNGFFLYGHYVPGDGLVRTQGLSYASRQSGFPSRLDISYFYNKSDHISACFSADGTVMILAMDSYSGQGNEDLYVSIRNGNEWSEPKNMGTTINTSHQEMTPYLAPDNITLFFSSNGHGGFGGRDVFVAKRLDDTWTNWSTPRNLGERFNTAGIELSFTYNTRTEWAMYTSTTESDGHSDIRQVYYPLKEIEELVGTQISAEAEPTPRLEENKSTVETFALHGLVTDTDGSPVNATITIQNSTWTTSVEAKNGYEIQLPGGGVYEVQVKAKGYVGTQDLLDLRASQITRWNHDFVLQPARVGVTVQLDHVLFVRGTTELIESSFDQLDLVVAMLEDNPDLRIHLTGHTDNQGDQRLNKLLSKDRVDAVIDYLVKNGIDRNRLSGEGKGGEAPIASNASEETRKLNRRVEFTIVK